MKKTLIVLLSVLIISCLFVSCIIPFSDPILEKEMFTVSFNMNGHGTQVATITDVMFGSKIEAPTDPTAIECVFGGWYKDISCTDLSKWNFEEDTVTENIILYAKWSQSECIAAGTKITMQDGSLKTVEELEIGNVVRTFDHETGLISSAPICFVMKYENARGAFILHFENNIDVTVIEEHGFYDNDLDKYVFINSDNAKDYIGHHFYNADKMCQVKLVGSENLKDNVDAYSIVTSKHLNHMAEGMLSISDGSTKLLANIFEYDKDLKIDEVKKAQDIKTYGLTAKEVFVKYNGFEDADYEDYNMQFFNIMIGKGFATWEEIEEFYNLCAEYLQND